MLEVVLSKTNPPKTSVRHERGRLGAGRGKERRPWSQGQAGWAVSLLVCKVSAEGK